MAHYETGTLSTTERVKLREAGVYGVLHTALEQQLETPLKWVTIRTAQRVKERVQRGTERPDGTDQYEQYMGIGVVACDEDGMEKPLTLRVDRESSWGLDGDLGEEGEQHKLVGGFAEEVPIREVDATKLSNTFKALKYADHIGHAALYVLPESTHVPHAA
ncbi:MAG TPA: hypothetical protein VLE74_00545 [Candidatus Saccharimonadales bacterium]|nr:hypothetical protein [Candidatus Saccharimonadales bacterium]